MCAPPVEPSAGMGRTGPAPSPGRAPAGGEAGFTLAEAIVALAIVVLAFAALYQAFALGAGGYRRAERSLAGLALARSLLAGAGAAERLAPGERTGRSGRFAWRLSASPYAERPAAADERRLEAYWVSVTVSWPGLPAGGRQSITLATLKLQEPAGP